MGRLRVDRMAGPPGELRDGAGRVLLRRCYRARGPVGRLVGLLGTPDLAPDEGLWLEPCGSVHGLGLRARVGCALLDEAGRVLRVVDPLPPGTIAAARGARVAVEAPAGLLRRVVPPGDVLRLVPPGP